MRLNLANDEAGLFDHQVFQVHKRLSEKGRKGEQNYLKQKHTSHLM